MLPGKFVCEIKHSGFTKASGVRELMTHEPFRGRRPLFIGDDVTDETVFAIMPDMDGLAFSVGRRAMGVNGHFDSPADVRAFLAHLLDPRLNEGSATSQTHCPGRSALAGRVHAAQDDRQSCHCSDIPGFRKRNQVQRARLILVSIG